MKDVKKSSIKNGENMERSEIKFKKKLLKFKKKRFKEAVLMICNKRKLPTPYINFKGCKDEKRDELAHYHVELNKICVSKEQLNKMDFEDIVAVAAHEVSHILKEDHSLEFYKEESKSKIASFKVPSGVIHIRSNEIKEIKEDKRKNRVDKTRCNYHLCRKRRKLIKCKYCKKYFCREHSKPYEPSVYTIEKHSEKRKGHPCLAYVDFLIKKSKKEDDEYKKALYNLLKRKETFPILSEEKIEITKNPQNILKDIKEEHFPIKVKKLPSFYWQKYKKYLYILLILILVFIIFLYRQPIINTTETNYNKYFERETNFEEQFKSTKEIIDSRYKCEAVSLEERPFICKKVCYKNKGRYIEYRCMGEDILYCIC